MTHFPRFCGFGVAEAIKDRECERWGSREADCSLCWSCEEASDGQYTLAGRGKQKTLASRFKTQGSWLERFTVSELLRYKPQVHGGACRSMAALVVLHCSVWRTAPSAGYQRQSAGCGRTEELYK